MIDDDFVQSTAVKTSNKKGTITETESQREIYLHIAEGDSNEGSWDFGVMCAMRYYMQIKRTLSAIYSQLVMSRGPSH